MKDDCRLQLKFWGVRGSIPTPIRRNLDHGGNTSCLEVRLPDGQVLIFDAGTGIRDLGNSLIAQADGRPLALELLFTHFHGDHVHGLPFFTPLDHEENEITFRARRTKVPLADILEGHIREPYVPFDFSAIPARRNLIEFEQEPMTIAGATVTPFPLNHPQGATGYRIEREKSDLSGFSGRYSKTNRLICLPNRRL